MAGRTQWCNGCGGPLPPQPCAWCGICGLPAPGYGGAPPGYWTQPDTQFFDGKKCQPWRANMQQPPIRALQQHIGALRPGIKRALLIGITYKRPHWQLGGQRLKGAGNDVKWMKYLLQRRFRFPAECILVLTDEEQTDPSKLPTRDNMVAAMKWLVRDCQQGASLVFYFSGHGSQQKDQDGDELDGLDEVLYPMDYRKSGVIVDDEINQIMVRPLPAGVKLHAFIDACYSGSALDLDFVCNNRNGIYQWEGYSRKSKGTSGGYAICFSSCRDDQKSEEIDVTQLSSSVKFNIYRTPFDL